jgi:hypothetical protein
LSRIHYSKIVKARTEVALIPRVPPKDRCFLYVLCSLSFCYQYIDLVDQLEGPLKFG